MAIIFNLRQLVTAIKVLYPFPCEHDQEIFNNLPGKTWLDGNSSHEKKN